MDKPKVGILTSFTGADPAYSLVNVVRTQLSILMARDYAPRLIVAENFRTDDPFWDGKRFEIMRCGHPEDKFKKLSTKLREVVSDLDVVLCHDLVFLHQNRHYGEAVRILAKEYEHIAWLHWQHSRGGHAPIEPVEHSWFCYPNNGDLEHVAKINSASLDRVRYVPHLLDFDYLGWPELAIRIAEDTGFPFADVAMIYPSRLDRQKQHDKLLRVFAGLKRAGKKVCLLMADAYATGEPFLSWKKELHQLAEELGLEDGKDYLFLSENYPDCRVTTPRPVVKALYEMSNLFMQTSNAETSSLVVMEAALAGCMIILNSDFKPIHHLYAHAIALPFGSIFEDTKYYRHVTTVSGEVQKIEDPQAYWDDQARDRIAPLLNSYLGQSVKRQQFQDRWPSRVFSDFVEPLMLEAWESVKIKTVNFTIETEQGDPDVTAIITTIDNLPMLKRQIPILLNECGNVIVVNNGSLDGTEQWLENFVDQPRVRWLNRENMGAGPGRNAGLDMWNYATPYTLMLDGGILPPRGGVKTMKEYLERHPEIAVISPEVATGFTTDENEAARVMVDTIPDERTFQQGCLSGTAYALVRAEAWRKARFSEEGPFAEPGWGADDNELMYHWDSLGIIHRDWDAGLNVKLYRRQAGSFERLFRETGIWPNQYGSVFEKRCVLMFQKWQFLYDPFWRAYGNIEKSFIIRGIDYPDLAYVCKRMHDQFKEVSHEVIVITEGLNGESMNWLSAHALRWPHGDTIIDADGNIIKRITENEDIWTGNIILDKPPRGKEVIEIDPDHPVEFMNPINVSEIA